MKWTLFFFLLLSASLFSQDMTELTGNELFGGLRARHIGPALMSGRVSDVEGHPTNDKIIYIGTAGGGVWKSQDGGVIFKSIFDPYCQSIGTVTVDPHDPDKTVWVGTGEIWTRNSTSVGDGIYKTVDGGKNWKKMGLESSERISSIQIHPENPDVLFVGVLGKLWGDSEDRGIYKTTDGGATWEKLFYVNERTGCSDLLIDPTNPNRMYATFWEHRRTAWSFNSGGESSAIYQSSDGGNTWNKIHQGLPKGKLGRIALALAPSNSKILYASVESEDASKSGMYRSDDSGASWKHLNNDFELVVRPFYFSRIVVHPRNPETVIKAGFQGSISHDGGKTFKRLGAMHPDIHDAWFDIKSDDKLFVATDGGLYRSLDGGNVMEIIENLPISQFYHVSVDQQQPYSVYGGLQDNGSWFGPSASPGGIEGRDWEVIGVGDGFRVYPHPKDPQIIYSEMQGAATVWKYNNRLRQTRQIQPFKTEGDPTLRFNWNTPIVTSMFNPDRLYIGSQFVHRSEDQGGTWAKISPDLTTNDPAKQNQRESGGLSKDNSGAENHCTIFTIAESPLNQEVIWVGTDDGNVQVTRNGGKSWKNVTDRLLSLKENALPKNTWCYHIEASHFDEGTAYAVFDGHTKNDPTAYCYRTTDYGQTWTSIITPEIHGFARSFQEDLENPNLLFLGTEFGLYISLTGGKKWMKFTNNVPAVAIHHMEMQPQTNDLVLGTHGRGIIIIDDVSPLRQMTKEILQEKLVFFKMNPFEMNEESTFGGTSSEVQFVGENPPSGARIVYFLGKRHTFGKMAMTIFDMNGNFVVSLSPGKKRGLNIVNWNFQRSAPKIAAGKTFNRGGMFGPRVPEGKYRVEIVKGKDVFETVIEVQYPKNSMYTHNDREAHEQVTQRLYTMNEDLAYLVYEIEETVAHGMRSKSEEPRLAKVADQLASELTELRKTLVVTTGDNYVDKSENQLREDLGEIYRTIGSNYGAPTKSQIEAVKLIEKRMKKAREQFDAIQRGVLRKYLVAVEKWQLSKLKIMTYSEFVKKVK